MTRLQKIIVAGSFGVILLVLGWLWLTPAGTMPAPEVEVEPVASRGGQSVTTGTRETREATEVAPTEPNSTTRQLPAVVSDDGEETVTDEGEPEQLTPEEQVVKQWEATLDPFTALKDEPRKVEPEDRQTIKKTFARLSKQQQDEEIHHAMNLLPDATVNVLDDILLDPAEDADVLDVIFSDILNRDESVKMPVLQAIAKDKTHPCYVEAARILDIVGDVSSSDDTPPSDNEP